MRNSFNKKNYNRFISYFPPELIIMLGGKKKIIKKVSVDPLKGKGKALGSKIIKISKIIKEKNQLSSFITIQTDL